MFLTKQLWYLVCEIWNATSSQCCWELVSNCSLIFFFRHLRFCNREVNVIGGVEDWLRKEEVENTLKNWHSAKPLCVFGLPRASSDSLMRDSSSTHTHTDEKSEESWSNEVHGHDEGHIHNASVIEMGTWMKSVSVKMTYCKSRLTRQKSKLLNTIIIHARSHIFMFISEKGWLEILFKGKGKRNFIWLFVVSVWAVLLYSHISCLHFSPVI